MVDSSISDGISSAAEVEFMADHKAAVSESRFAGAMDDMISERLQDKVYEVGAEEIIGLGRPDSELLFALEQSGAEMSESDVRQSVGELSECAKSKGQQIYASTETISALEARGIANHGLTPYSLESGPEMEVPAPPVAEAQGMVDYVEQPKEQLRPRPGTRLSQLDGRVRKAWNNLKRTQPHLSDDERLDLAAKIVVTKM